MKASQPKCLLYNNFMESVFCGAHVSSNIIVFSAPHAALATEPSLDAPSADGKAISRYYAEAFN